MFWGSGDNTLSSHTSEFDLTPFPKESKNILFEPRLLLIPLLSHKDEVPIDRDCYCQLQSPLFCCRAVVPLRKVLYHKWEENLCPKP